jgi:hypothetical protein
MPGRGDEPSARPGASAVCWQLYGELAGFEAEHLVRLGRLHQLMVDTYVAQHPTADGPTIGLAFALIGLHLALDEGWRGDQVRDAHQLLATTRRDWPRLDPPRTRGPITVLDVAMAGSPDEHAELLQRWAAAVWDAWREQQATVVGLLDERLPSDERARLRAR